jgi:hypothetical protein
MMSAKLKLTAVVLFLWALELVAFLGTKLKPRFVLARLVAQRVRTLAPTAVTISGTARGSRP